jgi:hypothetical protein
VQNTNPHKVAWYKNILSKLIDRFDVNQALHDVRKNALREGIELGTKYCFAHSDRVLKRIISPGRSVCDACEMDAHVNRWFEHGPTTGPHQLYTRSGLLHIPLPQHSQWAKENGRIDTQQREAIILKNANNGYVYGNGRNV